jgi:AcrR family transcriptional regulator
MMGGDSDVVDTTAPRRTQRQAQADQTRRTLLNAAVRQFSERNFDEVATTDITETAGVAQGLLFHYFGSKRGIYLEALRDAAEQLNAANTPQVSDGTPGQQYRQMLQSHLRYLSEHEGLALRLVLGGSGGDPDAWEIFERTRWRTIEWTCQLLGLDADRPALRLSLRACIGAVDEATVYWLKTGHPFEQDAVVELLVKFLITALEGAARLDSNIDVTGAITLLR